MTVDRIVSVIMLVSLTMGAGLQVDRSHLIAIFKNIGLLARALIANFIVVPAVGVLVARIFRLEGPFAAGFLLMAIAPGVPFVLASVRKRGGSLALAVELAFFLPLISIVTVPLTAALVLPAAAEAHLPIARFATTLILFQLIPLLVGIAIAGRAPGIAARLQGPFQIVFFLSAALLVALFVPTLARDVASVYGSKVMWATVTLVVVCLGLGWLFGGPARENRRVLAIGTALHNVGLCAVIATANFDNPDVAATVLVYLLIQFIVTSIVGVYFSRTAKAAIA